MGLVSGHVHGAYLIVLIDMGSLVSIVGGNTMVVGRKMAPVGS